MKQMRHWIAMACVVGLVMSMCGCSQGIKSGADSVKDSLEAVTQVGMGRTENKEKGKGKGSLSDPYSKADVIKFKCYDRTGGSSIGETYSAADPVEMELSLFSDLVTFQSEEYSENDCAGVGINVRVDSMPGDTIAFWNYIPSVTLVTSDRKELYLGGER